MNSETYDEDRPRKRRPPLDDELDEPRPRKRRRRFRWLVPLVLLLAFVAMLPTIVAKTPLRNMLVAWAVPSKKIQLTIGDASLGWFSPPAIGDVRMQDAAGKPLLAAESIQLERSPWALATNSRDLGTISIVRPTVYVTIRPDGSNWEDTVQEILSGLVEEEKPDDGKPHDSPPVRATIKLVEAAILAEDIQTGAQWRIEGVNFEYQTPSSANDFGRLTATGRIASAVAGAAPQTGSFAVSLAPLADGRQQVGLQLTGVPMMLADPALRRFLTGVEVSGTLSGEGTATWTANGANFPNDLTTSGQLRIERLDATAPALAGDRLQLFLVEMPWQLSARPDGLAIDRLELRSDVGQVALRGSLVTSTAGSLADSAAGHDVEVRGSLDLARLAVMLPHTLHIREGTTITSGSLDLTARVQPIDGGQAINGSLQTAALAGTAAGRPIRWDQPASATFALERRGQAIKLDALELTSDFLSMKTSGTPDELAVSANFDLAQLAAQLGQFVDLPTTELAGQGDLTANVQSKGEAVEVSDARLMVTKLRAVGTGWVIDEPRVELSGNARWDGATGQVSSDAAQLVTSTLSAATKDVRFQAGEQGIAQINGLAAFRVDLARLATWQGAASGPSPWQPQGMVTGNVRFDQQADRVNCELSADGQGLALIEQAPAGPHTIWAEPQMSVRGRATYEGASDRLKFDEMQVQSNMLQAAVNGQIEHLTTTADANIQGTLNYDLAQITPLLKPYLGDGIQLVGRETARFAVSGSLNQGSPSVAASSPYDIRPVSSSDSRAGSTFIMRAGSSSTPAMHWSRSIKARVEAPWASANVYGLPIGPGKIDATLGDGELRVEPLSLAVAEGRLTAAPFVRFDPEPSELTLPPGPLLTNVRITPQVSEKMLQFLAPVLSGVTQSEGEFSMQLAGMRVPLADSRRANAEGQLTVHAVRVAPGPLANQWIQVAQQIEAIAKKRDPLALAQGRQSAVALTIEDQTVNFRVADGRVYHQNMQFRVGDVVLRSQGSVGFDETLALTLTVPIQDGWVEGQKLLVGLKGQSLSIPIGGTLRRPQMDQRAVADLSGRMIQGAAQQTIGNEVNKALDKFFKPR